MNQVLEIVVLLLISLLALRLRPRFFIPPVLVEVLVRVAIGRRLLRSLGLGASHD